MKYHVLQFGHWNQVKADTWQHRYRYYISNWYIVRNANLPIHSSGDARAVTMSSSESDFCMVISLARDRQWLKLKGSKSCDFWIGDKLGIGAGPWDGMRASVCGSHKPSLIWLLPGQEVTCGICNVSWTLSRVSIGSPNFVGTGDAAWSAARVERQPEPSILSSRSSYPSHGSSQPRLPGLVASIHEASLASAENAPCDVVPFKRLFQSPSRVHHRR